MRYVTPTWRKTSKCWIGYRTETFTGCPLGVQRIKPTSISHLHQHLKWPNLGKRRQDIRLTYMCKIIHGNIAVCPEHLGIQSTDFNTRVKHIYWRWGNTNPDVICDSGYWRCCTQSQSKWLLYLVSLLMLLLMSYSSWWLLILLTCLCPWLPNLKYRYRLPESR